MKKGKLYTDEIFGGVYKFDDYHEDRLGGKILLRFFTIIPGKYQRENPGQYAFMTLGVEYRLKEL